MADHFDRLLASFPSTRVLVVGDIMADQYVWGSVDRISPEAPVPVVSVNEETLILGGAANVVSNLHTLGAQASIAGVVGEDEMGEQVGTLLIRKGLDIDGLVKDFSRGTTLKTRIIANNQQIARIDREDSRDISTSVLDRMEAFLKERIPHVDAVIISDYGKGVVTRDLIQRVVALTTEHQKICTVDPKVNHFDLYAGTTLITPNHVEAGAALGRKIVTVEDVHDAARALKEKVRCKGVLVTFGAKGMCLLDEQNSFLHIDTVAKKVFDVTGAGDTVISTFTLALAAGGTMEMAAQLSNAAAGLVVGEFGTATVQPEQLARSLWEVYP